MTHKTYSGGGGFIAAAAYHALGYGLSDKYLVGLD